MLQNIADHIVRIEFLGINPHTLAHKERIVAYLFLALDFESGQKLIDDQINFAVEILEEEINVAVRTDGNARQIDRGERQVAAAR